MRCNYHTHNILCDGKDSIEAIVNEASKLHFDQLGFSSHAPVEFENDFGIKEEDIPIYKEEIQRLQTLHPEIELFTALECDFIPGYTKPFHYFTEKYQLDYIIGGVHLVRPPHAEELWFIDGSKQETYDNGLSQLFDNNIQKAVTTFWEQTFEMIETQHFDIIAHFDKIKMHNHDRFFKEDELWYKQLSQHAIELIKRKGLIVEINLRGIYKKRCNSFYPSAELLQAIVRNNIPIVISSDAHKAEELDLYYNEAIEAVKKIGFSTLLYRHNHQWKEYSI